MANVNITLAYPTRTIFHLLVLGLSWARVGSAGVGVGFAGVGVGSARFFRYQHVGISNVKRSCWGLDQTLSPNTSGFALQWNIGFKLLGIDLINY